MRPGHAASPGSLRSVMVVMSLLVRQDKWRSAIAFTLILAQALSGPLIALSLAWLTTAAVGGNAGQAVAAGAVTGALAVAQLTMGHFAHNTVAQVGEQASIAIDAALITMVQGTGDLAAHEDSEYADRLALLRDEVGGLPYTAQAVAETVAVLVQLAVSLWLLARLQPLLLVLPFFAVMPFLAGGYAQRASEKAQMETATVRRSARFLTDLVRRRGTAQEVRLAGLQDELRRRQRRLLGQESAVIMRAQTRAAWVTSAGQVVFALGYAGSVILVVHTVVAGHGSVGSVVLVIMLARQVNAGVGQILAIANSAQRAARIGARWEWLRAAAAGARPRDDGAPAPARISDAIVLDSVSFRYPGASGDTLHDVSLTVPAGSVVALVGENGAGKSTLVKLLCRLYEPAGGRITVDGRDLSEFAAGSWQDGIAAAFQDYGRLEFTVAQTVGVGDLPRIGDRAAVGAALVKAGADAVVSDLPDGLDAEVGKSLPAGRDLSGGQWQRLALARGMMRPAPLLLVMDEPTAALDATAEHAIFERQTQRARDVAVRTGAITVLVSHRFSTVAMADLIVVIDDGRIREHGTHADLIAAGGTYAELYETQARNYRK